MRGPDIPGLLREVPRSIGMLTCDNLLELPEESRQQLSFEPIKKAYGAKARLRYGLACRPDQAKDVAAQLEVGRQVYVGTSAPGVVRDINRQYGFNMVAEPESGGYVAGGQVEKLLGLMPWLDGVVDIVETGGSLRENELELVKDDLYQLQLGIVWPALAGVANA